MRIYVIPRSGKTTTLDVSPLDTVGSIKPLLDAGDQGRAIEFDGHLLNEGYTFTACGVMAGTTLRVVPSSGWFAARTAFRSRYQGSYKTPLHFAAEGGHVNVIRLLLACRAPHRQDSSGATPVYRAAEAGHYDAVELLLHDHPASAIESDGLGVTPLHVAAERGDGAMVELLLRYGPPKTLLCIQDYMGRTALHSAAQSGKGEVLSLLLRYHPEGAHVKDGDGRTPGDLILRK